MTLPYFWSVSNLNYAYVLTVAEDFVGLRADLDSEDPLIFVAGYPLSPLHNVLRQQSKFQVQLDSRFRWSKLLFSPVVTATKNMAILVSR